MILVLPAAFAVTSPEPFTVATDGSDKLHVTFAPGMANPFASFTDAVDRFESPGFIFRRDA